MSPFRDLAVIGPLASRLFGRMAPGKRIAANAVASGFTSHDQRPRDLRTALGEAANMPAIPRSTRR
jgi:hypothetical protein